MQKNRKESQHTIAISRGAMPTAYIGNDLPRTTSAVIYGRPCRHLIFLIEPSDLRPSGTFYLLWVQPGTRLQPVNAAPLALDLRGVVERQKNIKSNY